MIINLGDIAKDKITGFEGVITGKASYLTGCDQYCIQPKVKDGDSGNCPDAKWFDEGRIDPIFQGPLPYNVKAERNGSDYTAPIK